MGPCTTCPHLLPACRRLLPLSPSLTLLQPHGSASCSSPCQAKVLPQDLGTCCAPCLQCSSLFAHMSPPQRGPLGLPRLFKNIHPSSYPPHKLPIIPPFDFSHHSTNTKKSNLFFLCIVCLLLYCHVVEDRIFVLLTAMSPKQRTAWHTAGAL